MAFSVRHVQLAKKIDRVDDPFVKTEPGLDEQLGNVVDVRYSCLKQAMSCQGDKVPSILSDLQNAATNPDPRKKNSLSVLFYELLATPAHHS